MVCTAPWKAWQTTERGLRQSRTPHARSSCIIGHFLTIAWGTQILAIGDSQVRSYDRRTVSVEWSVRRANCKRFTHIRPTDGSGPTTVGWSGERRSQWRCMDRLGCPTLRRFQRLLVLCLLCFEFSLKQNNSTVNCQPLRSFSRVKPVGDRLHRQQTHAKVKCTCSFRIRPKNKRLTSHCRGESRAGTPCNSFCFPRRRANHIALESDALP
jgi:hypothetical protein